MKNKTINYVPVKKILRLKRPKIKYFEFLN